MLLGAIATLVFDGTAVAKRQGPASARALPLLNVAAPPVKLSRNSICHARGTKYYAQTKHFTSFQSIDACLRAGGRLPRR